MKKKILEIADESEQGMCEQTVFDPETDGELFYVYGELTERLEDETINGGLFDAGDYLRAVRYGIELAKEGYDEVEYVSIKLKL